MTEIYRQATKDHGNVAKELLPTDRHPADDLCLLSAMSLSESEIKALVLGPFTLQPDPFPRSKIQL